MSDYTYIAVLQNEIGSPIICETAAWPEVKPGDKVLWGSDEPSEAICLTKPCMLDNGEMQFLATALGTTLPFPRIRGRVRIDRFEYDDEKAPAGADTPTGDTDG